MEESVKRELSQRVPTKFHVALLEHCKALVEMSRSDMSDFYDKWEQADMVYRGKRYEDKDDQKAKEKGAPTKIVVPLTYAQVQTFVAFAMNLLLQRDHFFEMEGTGEEDHRAAKLAEALLDQNLEHSQFSGVLYQFLLDIARFSIGVIKESWDKETERVWVEKEVPDTGSWQQPMKLLGQLFNPTPRMKKIHVSEDQVSYVGNTVRNISPFCFFPDTRFPLHRFQEGEFCASEEEMSKTKLRKLQADEVYAGVEHIEDMKPENWKKRKGQTFGHVRHELSDRSTRGQIESTVVVTTVQVEITPSKFMLSDGTPLGTSDVPEKWLVDYANDTRIIRAQPLGHVHNNFTYGVAEFSPDQQKLVNESITEMVGHLQAVIDWFINSHITNVRKHISNRLVVDPAGVMFEDLRDHKPVIRLKASAGNAGVERYVKQLNVSDVTRGHISDVQTLMQFVHMTTSISDNLMGQFHSGRRSAREAANISNASGTRLRTTVKLIYDMGLKPLGRNLVSNLRDGLDEDTFVTVTGDEFPDWQAYDHFTLKDGRTKVKVNRTNLAGRFDFKVFEGILPSDKHIQAETLENTLMVLMKNPDGLGMLTQVLGYDPKKLFKEVLELRGIKHSDRFKIDQVRMQELQMLQQQQMMMQQPQNQNAINPNTGQPGVPAGAVPGPVQQPPATFESLVG